jgi:D-glycero-alpha-D-manno-heptose-7-phosphate kinase
MAKRISVRAPARIDLAGGWTDVPNYCNTKSGEVVNIAINHYTNCIMEIDDERKITLSYSTDMPTGSGLGTSGCMNVGLISTILGSGHEPEEIAELAYQFEALLGNKGGRQDQWASAIGGISHLTFKGETVEQRTLKPSSEFISWLEDRLLLFNSKITHVSGDLHKGVWEKFHQGDETIVEALDEIREAGLLMAKAIEKESKNGVIDSLKHVMSGVDSLGLEFHDPFRMNLESYISTGDIAAWKAMGAGGGGVVGVLLSENCLRDNLIEDLQSKGWAHIDWKIDKIGLSREETIL